MKIEELKTYMEEYVKPYLPYRESKLYNVVINFLGDKYFTDMYEDVPNDLKSLYEDNIIISSIYDQLLLGLGVHENVVKKLSFNEKIIFLKSVSDFQRYKGSVSFFKKIANAFQDKFDIYELFVDWNESNQSWILKPSLIYKGIEFESNLENLSYQEAYESVPSLLISPEQLQSIKDDNNAAFPLKTNMVLLDYNIDYDTSIIKNVIISTVLKEYGDTPLTIYMRDDSFDFTVQQVYYIWYYILTRYYDSKWTKFMLKNVIHFSTGLNPYTMKDLDLLVQKYNDIATGPDTVKFFNEYIDNYFSTVFRSDEQNESSMRYYANVINNQFYMYITNRVDSVVGDAEKVREYNAILTEIYNSLLLFYNEQSRQLIHNERTNPSQSYGGGNDSGYSSEAELFSKYFEVLMLSLSQIVVNPENTTSYLILYNLKPYHVELLSRARDSIISDGKMNTVIPDVDYNFLFELNHADFVQELEDVFIFNIDIEKINNVTMEEDFQNSFLYDHTDSELTTTIDDSVISVYKKYATSIQQIRNDMEWDFTKIKHTDLILNDTSKFDMSIENLQSVMGMIDSSISGYEKFATSIQQMGDDMGWAFTEDKYTDIAVIDSFEVVKTP